VDRDLIWAFKFSSMLCPLTTIRFSFKILHKHLSVCILQGSFLAYPR